MTARRRRSCAKFATGCERREASQPLPGAEAVGEKFDLFEADYPATCAALHLDPQAIVFVDLCEIIRGWLAENG